MTSTRLIIRIAACVLLVAATAGQIWAGEVTLVDKGVAQCVIVVPPSSMKWQGDDKPLNKWSPHSEEPERVRRLLRDSVRDLALYLEKMSGAPIEVVEGISAGEKRLPIYIGAAAEKMFGPVGISFADRFGFRAVARSNGVGLYGESEYGTSYAIYELLHRLGCRWYMPSPMGECIPSLPTIAVEEMELALAPATEWRRMENRTADADFRRRNRMGGSGDGGNVINAMHTLEGYITKEQREAHPEWRLLVDGKPHPTLLRWTRQDVADAIGDAIIKRLDEKYATSVSLSPGDYVVPTDDPEEMKHDPTPRVWEPAANQWSVTDRLIMLANRVAERVGTKYPDVRFGLLVYVNYSMPPARESVHPKVIPQLAPIDFNRQHPMTWENHPNDKWLLNMLQGWAAKAPRLAYYAYGFNLAELTAPNPFITKWKTDLPIILENNVAFWTPETMGGWDSMMPGYYLSIRMTFDPKENPDEILDEMMKRFYGPAAETMSRYWRHIDRAWIDAREYSGGGFGYLRIFTPEIMTEARSLLDQAHQQCQSDVERQRVQMVRDTFTLFELFMKMRQDYANGELETLALNFDRWGASLVDLRTRYQPQFVLQGLAKDYVDLFFGRSYKDASRMEAQHARVGRAMVEWKYHRDEQSQAEANGWTTPGFDDGDWPMTHVVRQTWSSIGHHNTMGRMVYRTTQEIEAVPDGKRVTLWIGSTDGTAKLFVNGQHVPYVVAEDTRQQKKGDVVDAFSGYCQPAAFDVTGLLKPGKNQFTIVCERKWLNELGTGGLMGPVVVFRER